MDNFAPLISIIVPIYKVEKYLPRCIDSLINQTYQNLEIILVDDGSPDRSGEICDEYAKKDSRIVVVHKPNGGLSDARNKGLDVANGDYVMFVDSDDWIEKESCEILVNLAKEKKSDVVSFAMTDVYDNGKKIPSKTPYGTKIISSEEAIKAILYNHSQFGIFNRACNKFYSKSLLLDTRFPVGKLTEDQGFTYKILHKAKRICVCENHLYNYYRRSGSISFFEFYPQLKRDEYSFWLERLDFLKSNYPNIVKYQISQLLGDMFIGKIVFKNNASCKKLNNTINSFIEEYGSCEKSLVRYNKRIFLHYYCYPLFWIYVKFRFSKRS